MADTTPHVPTDISRAEVSALTSFGNTQEEIASYLHISVDTLTRHYRDELDNSVVRANAKVAAKLFRKAIDGDDIKAQIFWLKTRAKWREKDRDEEKDDATSVLEKIMTGEIKVKQ
jgi:hypothetical protein